MAVRAGAQADDGFTLIELMVVMVVLSILSGIILFAVGRFSEQASSSACTADTRSLQTANAAYQVGHGGADAPNIDALVTDGLLSERPKSGVTITNGVVDASACGAPVLALTPDDTTTLPPTTEAPTTTAAPPALAIGAAYPSRRNSSQGHVHFTGTGATGTGGVVVKVYDNATCTGRADDTLDAAPAADSTWESDESGNLGDARPWWAQATQGTKATECFPWSMPNY